MTARQRIEELTYTWYGFTVFAAVASIVQAALWPLSASLLFSPIKLALAFLGSAFSVLLAIGLNVVFLVVNVLIVRAFGRALLGRSAITRVFLVLASAVLAVLHAWSGLQQLWNGVSHLSVAPLVGALVAAVAVALYLRSFRVLSHPDVRAYSR
jgi:hypothetical protein